MAKYQSRSDEEWLQIINECRRSGLSDSQWYKQHDIREYTFFCAVGRLRKKVYAMMLFNAEIMSFTSSLSNSNSLVIFSVVSIFSISAPTFPSPNPSFALIDAKIFSFPLVAVLVDCVISNPALFNILEFKSDIDHLLLH